jgi:hypothetical protein
MYIGIFDKDQFVNLAARRGTDFSAPGDHCLVSVMKLS